MNDFKLKENSTINIYGNILIEETLKDMDIKYINFFNLTNKDTQLCQKYLFFLNLSKNNILMLLDTKNILDGKLLKNKYNDFIAENNILLLFLKIKTYIVSELNKIVPDNDYYEEIVNILLSYENLFEQNYELLDKNLPRKKINSIIKLEVNKFELRFLSVSLILSFYLYKNYSKDILLDFIKKVNILTDKFIEENFNLPNFKLNKDLYWNYIITSI